MWLTHVDLRSRCTLRKIPFDRIVSINVCASATIKISLIVCLQAIEFSTQQTWRRRKLILTQDDQDPA